MPSWKKVVVSGSDAILSSLNVTNAVTASLFTGSFVGDGSGLTNLPIDTSDLVTTSSFNDFTSSYTTGSFTGSFIGDGSGLTGIAEDTFPFTGSAVISGSLEVTGSIFSNIFLNPQTITDDIIIPDGYNGIILGPVDLQGNVTVGSGSNLIVFEDFLTTVKLTEENEFTAVQTFSPSINIVSSSYGYGEVEDVTDEIQTVSSVDAEEYKAAFFDYVISDGTNFRAGTITSVWDYINTLISQTEVSTTDIGDTTNVTLNVILDGNLAKLQAETTGSGWDIQTLVRTL